MFLKSLAHLFKSDASSADIREAIAEQEESKASIDAVLAKLEAERDAAIIVGGEALATAMRAVSETEALQRAEIQRGHKLKARLEEATAAERKAAVLKQCEEARRLSKRAADRLEQYNDKLAPEIARIIEEVGAAAQAVLEARAAQRSIGLAADVLYPNDLCDAVYFHVEQIKLPSLRGGPHYNGPRPIYGLGGAPL